MVSFRSQPIGLLLNGSDRFMASNDAQTQFMETESGRIAFDDTGGTGPVVIGIPGMGDLRSEYRLVKPMLQHAGCRVVTMDVRGFGESSAEWPDYSARAVSRDAISILQQLGAGPATIMGNSFAAGSALWAAREFLASSTGWCCSGRLSAIFPSRRSRNLSSRSDAQARGVLGSGPRTGAAFFRRSRHRIMLK